MKRSPGWFLRARRGSAACVAVASLLASSPASAERTLEQYRYFRALSIDLQGRIPTRDELATFERDDFNLDAWITQRVAGDAYADRVRMVYQDLLRLEISNAFNFTPSAVVLRRQQILGPNGAPMYVYYRQAQRRTRVDTDGAFCLTQSEIGVQVGPSGAQQDGTLRPVSRAALDANTVVVRPWWLYRDYRAATPTDRYSATEWGRRFPMFQPVSGLLREPSADPMVPGADTTTVRVCREEALTAATGTVFSTGRTTRTTPPNRIIALPPDTAFARAHQGDPIACSSATAMTNSADCGCGPGLERCMPGANANNDPQAFTIPDRTPLGADLALSTDPDSQEGWHRFWWAQEVSYFLDQILSNDRDFRDVLTAEDTWVNGPLTQFYRSFAGSTCCNNAVGFNYFAPQPLLDPAALPNTLLPHDTTRWEHIAHRGPHAAGILTMPAFLTKYGSRRSRAHVLYNAFLCRDFVAENVTLSPSTEANLMIRPGCALCHTTLEPLAAYFTRVVESDWTWLPSAQFPLTNRTCAIPMGGAQPVQCRPFYDPAFSTPTDARLRGSYGSPAHADEGPAGAGRSITTSPDFATCVATNVASSFLGRELTPDDEALKQSLAQTFVTGNYRMRALVGALVRSEAYRAANNLSSTALRQSGAVR